MIFIKKQINSLNIKKWHGIFRCCLFYFIYKDLMFLDGSFSLPASSTYYILFGYDYVGQMRMKNRTDTLSEKLTSVSYHIIFIYY